MTANFLQLLPVLVNAKVRFIIIGGVAAVAHGSSRATQDIDLVYSRDLENLEKIAAALGPHHPYLRGAPAGLPFVFDVQTLRHGLNFTLTTDLGDVDLLGEVAGGGTFDQLLPNSESLEVAGIDCLFVTLPKLIELKRAAGRPRDLEAIAELEALLEDR